MTRGLFLTLEGVDGSGKGTQLIRLKRYMQAKGKDVLYLREPGGTEIGEKIRSLLLGRENSEMTDKTELLLFAAARAQIVEEKILPALEAGRWVLCDRFYDSTLAYQAGGRQLDRDLVWQAVRLAVGDLEPDATFYLDLPPEAALRRREGREAEAGEEADRIEQESMAFGRAVRAEYLRLAGEFPRIRLIDADRPPEEVWMQIEPILDSLLEEEGCGA